MDLGLKDMRALVTGASRGLGYAVALGLAREGCRVAINSRDKAKISAAAGKIAGETEIQVIGLAGDVSGLKVPARLVAETVRALGGLDILVTNAGGPPAGAFESFDERTWQKAVDLSFMSHVRLIRLALPHLRQSPAASVLTNFHPKAKSWKAFFFLPSASSLSFGCGMRTSRSGVTATKKVPRSIRMIPCRPMDTKRIPARSGVMMDPIACPICIMPLARPKSFLGTSMVTDAM